MYPAARPSAGNTEGCQRVSPETEGHLRDGSTRTLPVIVAFGGVETVADVGLCALGSWGDRLGRGERLLASTFLPPANGPLNATGHGPRPRGNWQEPRAVVPHAEICLGPRGRLLP